MARNYFDSPLETAENAFDRGFDRTQAIGDRIATVRAGRKMAEGDRLGAAKTFAKRGLIAPARQMQADQQAEDDRAADERAGRAAMEEKMKAQRAAAFIKIAEGLGTVPEGQRQAALQQALPIFQEIGVDPTPFAQLQEGQLTNQQLALFVGEMKKYAQTYQNAEGIFGVTTSGQVDTLKRFQQKPIEMDPTKDYYVPEDGDAPAPVSQPASSGAGGASGFEAHIGPLLKREGGFVARDGRSGAPANFGINQKYNPDVDVKGLTPERAAQLYKTRYWDVIDGDRLPAEAQAAVFDAAVNQGPERARQWWQQSGGDLAKFNELRLQHYRTRPDYAQNGKSWERRVRETSGGAGALQGGEGSDSLQAPSGYRVVKKGSPEWVDLPGGGQRNTRTGKVEGISARDASKTFTQEQQLRAQFGNLPAVKDLAAVQSHVRTIGAIANKVKAGQSVTASDDLALIFAFMKMLDPGSVVREGEFANAQNTAGIPDRVVNAYNRALKGTRLSDKQRNEFFETASTVMDNYTNSAADRADQYRGLAKSYELDPERITPALKRPPAKKPAPRAGSATRPPLDQIFK
jgi:hypothetical protein